MRQQLNEILGVPDNIVETAEEIYNLLLKKLPRGKNIPADSYNSPFIIKGNFRIADFKFNEVNIPIQVKEFESLDEILLFALNIELSVDKGDIAKYKNISSEKLNIGLIIGKPSFFDYGEVYNFIRSQKDQITDSLSHELMHAYDHYKRPYESKSERSEYDAIRGHNFGIPVVDTFLHDIYYLTLTENIVRPSELASAIKNNQVSQEEFLDFLRSNQLYRNLRRINNFTIDDFKEKIKKEMKFVNTFLQNINSDILNSSDEEKVDEIMRLIWVNVTNWKIDNFKERLTENFLEEIIGFQGEKERVFRRFISRVLKLNNPEKFFSFYTNYFHEISDRMIRKIAKLYALSH
jgi:hypothetical protein